jgi:hypothetical protein
MTKNSDNFCGYLKVDDDTFAYNVSNNIVTLLPAQTDETQRDEALKQIRSHRTDFSEYLYGVAETKRKIAMLRNGKIFSDVFELNPYVQFSTPLIITACGNTANFNDSLTVPWNEFHAITFQGGNINALYNPKIAKEQLPFYKCSDGENVIKIQSWDNYTHSTNFEIDGEKATLTISVSQFGDTSDTDDMDSYSLGKLCSFIRISFVDSQKFDKIEKYYGIIKSLIAILTGQNNVFFDVYLSQRNHDDKYFDTGVCRIFDNYENYSTRKSSCVISINDIFDYVPSLIEKIEKDEVESLLMLLPTDNMKANRISITNIQDLCTALEVAYGWRKRTEEKDSLINELKESINKTIAKFTKDHAEIEPYQETTICSAFKYLDFTLKKKILRMYKENCDVINVIILKWSLPKIDEKNVGSFVNLRNGKTHSGKIEWGNNANLYTALLALVYACLLSSIGLSDEKTQSEILHQLF